MQEPNWIELGGWNAAYARVLAQDVTTTVAAALIDSNGDGSHLDVETAVIGENGDWEGWLTHTDVAIHDSFEFESYRLAWGHDTAGSQLDVPFSTTTDQVVVGFDGWWIFVRNDPARWVDPPPERRPIPASHEGKAYASTLTIVMDDGRVYVGDDPGGSSISQRRRHPRGRRGGSR